MRKNSEIQMRKGEKNNFGPISGVQYLQYCIGYL